jgi:phosphoserine phosphatase
MLSDLPPPYGTIVFDCDSTLSAMEGIEELSRGPHAALVARLTEDAMEGRIPLEAVFGRRLELVRPSRADVETIGRLYVERAVDGARDVVAALHALGKRVAIVSGGLLPAVRALARALDIEEVHAVDVRFTPEGAYAGFDERSPLARAGGKVDVLRSLAARAEAGALCFVGDGATDLEAAGEAARFVAYGGVVRRASVFAAARVTCTSTDFRALLPLLLSAAEIATLSRSSEHAARLGLVP